MSKTTDQDYRGLMDVPMEALVLAVDKALGRSFDAAAADYEIGEEAPE